MDGKRNTHTNFKRLAIFGSVLALSLGFVPGSANAADEMATLNIVTVVTNDHGGTLTPGDFAVQVSNSGTVVAGSPALGVGEPGKSFSLPAGTYMLAEAATPGYRGVWSGTITAGGTVTLVAGQVLTVTRTHLDMPNVVSGSPDPVATTPTTPTTTGGELPSTGTPFGNQLLLGGGLFLLGVIVIKTRRLLNN